MKKLLTPFLLLCSLAMFSQTYHFDYMLKSTNIRSKPKGQYESFDMVNSKNHALYMEISKNTVSKKYSAILIDKEKKETFRFDVSDINKNHVIFQFENKFFHSGGNDYYIFENLKIEKTGQQKYKIYPEKIIKPKNQIFEMEVQLEKFEDDLIIISFEPLISEQENEIESLIKNQLKSEDQTGNFYIKEMKIKYFRNFEIISKIVPKKVDVNL